MHGDPALAQTLTGFAPASLGVETEAAGPITADLGLAGHRENPADLIEGARGRGRRGPGTAADRTLIHLNELIDRFEPQDRVVPTSAATVTLEKSAQMPSQ